MATAEKILDYGTPDAYPDGLYDIHGVADGVETFVDVTEAHIAHFREQGYLAIHQAFTPAEVQDGLDGLFHLISGGNPDFSGLMFEKKAAQIDVDTLPAEQRQDYVRKFMWFVDYDARLKALSQHPKLIDLLTQLIGETPQLFQDMALIKPPRGGREKPWHQDHAYFNLPLDTTVVGVWIALDEATVENGCMVIKPGSHRQGPVVHFQRRDWQICDTHVRHGDAVAVPLQPGGCLLFHSLIHHGTPANNTNTRRRAVQYHYRPADAVQTSQEARLAIFGDEGRDVTC
ncbi:MAG: phytanoyl-CoA dioxygenase family protein, partial [Caldilineaceae bacterium]|nr:phytanoyl-CoA dioxygenase family protein [Caldilineaceae bacterium]